MTSSEDSDYESSEDSDSDSSEDDKPKKIITKQVVPVVKGMAKKNSDSCEDEKTISEKTKSPAKAPQKSCTMRKRKIYVIDSDSEKSDASAISPTNTKTLFFLLSFK